MDSAISLKDIPKMPPPPGQTSNFVNPDNQAELTLIMSSIFIGLVLTFGGIRVYSRAYLARSFTKDDCELLGFRAPNDLLNIDACVGAMVPQDSQ